MLTLSHLRLGKFQEGLICVSFFNRESLWNVNASLERASIGNREVKHDVYGKRQTAKMKLLPSLFRCVYSRVKLFVFAMNRRRRYSIFVCFIYGSEENNSKSEVVFAVCRLPLTSCLTSLLDLCLERMPVWDVCIWNVRLFEKFFSVFYALAVICF